MIIEQRINENCTYYVGKGTMGLFFLTLGVASSTISSDLQHEEECEYLSYLQYNSLEECIAGDGRATERKAKSRWHCRIRPPQSRMGIWITPQYVEEEMGGQGCGHEVALLQSDGAPPPENRGGFPNVVTFEAI